MQPRYEPHGVEERWQQTWEAEGLYNAEPDPAREAFVDCHPPPNVTGRLHTGHALNLSVGDALVRWKRMQGYNTLFQPGFDHAGISTQNVVEKALLAEGTSRQELGREHHAGDAALHVARPSPVDAAVGDDRGERIVRPALDRARRDDVDVAVQEQRPAAAASREPRGELGPPLEREAVRDHPVARDELRLGLEDGNLRSNCAEPVAEVGLERRLLAGRVAVRMRRRVEGDQSPQQLDELVLGGGDRVADAALLR